MRELLLGMMVLVILILVKFHSPVNQSRLFISLNVKGFLSYFNFAFNMKWDVLEKQEVLENIIDVLHGLLKTASRGEKRSLQTKNIV